MKNLSAIKKFTIIVVLAVSIYAMFSDHFIATLPLPIAAPAIPVDNTAPIDRTMKKVVEAHWQGMEAVPLTWELAAKLGIPLNEKGVLIDEVTLSAAQSGLMAKDIIQSVNGLQIETIHDFYAATKRIKNENRAALGIKRGGKSQTVELVVMDELGFAQLESAPMILSGAIPPHRYRGPCTGCHSIGSTGELHPDPEMVTLTPPPISKKTNSPHRYRGKCKLCHVVR